MEAVNWLKATVCGLQAGYGRSGNYRRCGLKLDKKEPAILSFHYKNSGSKVHTMSYSVLLIYSGSSNK